MPKYKIIVEELHVYGCTIEAPDKITAQKMWEQAANGLGEYEACKKFDETRDYDGYLELNVYNEDEYEQP